MQDVPMSETLALEPISDYGVAKAAATQFCLKETLFNKLPVYTIRPFSVYGDYEMPSRLIPTIMTSTILGEPIQLSSPHFMRDYIYIKDMVRLYRVVAQVRPHDAYIFNGGTGVQSSIQDVVSTVQELSGKTFNVAWGASTPRPWEPRAWKADVTRAQNVLGWQPAYDVHDGLKMTLEWFEKNLLLYAPKSAAVVSLASQGSSWIR